VGATYCTGTEMDGAKTGAVVVGGAAWKVTDVASAAADDAMLDERTVCCPEQTDTLAKGTDGCASTAGADGCASTVCTPGTAYVVCGTKDAGWAMVAVCSGAV